MGKTESQIDRYADQRKAGIRQRSQKEGKRARENVSKGGTSASPEANMQSLSFVNSPEL